ncbi:MAG: SAM-dependent methyltransferase [Pseudomonadota bacterium]
MTRLKLRLAEHIRAHGPIGLDLFMQHCLTDPEDGYYMRRDPLGISGDFVTAPEVSQVFGELIGVFLAQSWLDRGAPSPFSLVEFGPGRGTLMTDALRATATVPGFLESMKLSLLEVSPLLRQKQAQALECHSPTWTDCIADLPELPTFAVANEYFDALPIKQFRRMGLGWQERLVDVSASGAFRVIEAPVADHSHLAPRLEDTRDGDIVELRPLAENQINAISERLLTKDGVLLIVDYGDWRSLGDTLQALRTGQTADPTQDPGTADLTAHVDFEALTTAAKSAQGITTTRLTEQSVFLERLGVTQRFRALSEANPEQIDQLSASYRRLTDPAEMGSIFKAMAIYRDGAPLPPGFVP